MRNNFVFLCGCGRDFIDYICMDLNDYRNIKCINKIPECSWKEKKAEYIKQYGNGNVADWLYEQWVLREIHLKRSWKNYIILLEDYVSRVDWEIISNLKRKYDIRTILYIADPIEKRMNRYKDELEFYKEKTDLLITTDPEDAKKYNILFFPLIYSLPKEMQQEEVKYDLSFVGRGKNRTELIKVIENAAVSKNLEVFIQFREGINDNANRFGWMSYGEVLKIVKQSNCLLEILQEGQTAITLRTLEAICFGKKLITNNKNIVKYSFYDPRYIHVFEDISEIDYEFIRSKIEVKYNYNDECSPLKLIKYIVKRLR